MGSCRHEGLSVRSRCERRSILQETGEPPPRRVSPRPLLRHFVASTWRYGIYQPKMVVAAVEAAMATAAAAAGAAAVVRAACMKSVRLFVPISVNKAFGGRLWKLFDVSQRT